MSKHLTNKERDYIINCISNWDDKQFKLTWDSLCIHISKKLGRKPTRQSLNMHKVIVEALSAKKNVLKDKSKKSSKILNIELANKTIVSLQNKIKELEIRYNVLLEENVKLNYCCYLKGVSEKDLKSYLPKIERCNR